MQLLEVVRQVGQGTTIQKEARLSQFIGSVVEMRGSISGIESYGISLHFDDYDLERQHCDLSYDEGQFGAELLSYSYDDDVVVEALLKSASIVVTDISFKLVLLSIRRTGTTRSAREKQKMDEALRANSKCFVATACYGTANASNVLALQRFRDRVLIRSRGGRSFIAIYCRLSPPMAAAIERWAVLRVIVRSCAVGPLVAVLRRFSSFDR